MADERMLVLKMLETGKITAEQAAELLRLLSRSAAPVTPQRSEADRQTERELRQSERLARRQASRAMREEERQARRQLKREARAAKEQAGRIFAERDNWGRGPASSPLVFGFSLGGGQGYAFTKELDGTFTAPTPRIDIQNTNGRITVGRGGDDRWHLTLTVRVRAGGSDAAKELAESLVGVKSSGTSLVVESKRIFGQNAAVDIDLLVPGEANPDLQVSCTNGTITLSRLRGERISLRTVNGKILAESLDASEIAAHSVNGGVLLSGSGRKVNCRVANGRVQVSLTGQNSADLDLETVNGTIEICLPVGEAVGYEVEAVSTNGKLQVDLPNLRREEQTRPGRRFVRASSRDLETKKLRQKVRAKTVSGRISIYTRGGVPGDV